MACDPSSNHPLYAAFECPHRENCIAAVDRTTLQIVSEIGRQSGSATKTAAPGKLAHVPEAGLVFASAVSVGAFGYSGYMRLWDPRSGDVVWETSEPGGAGRSSRFGDSFADADVDEERLAVYKVCWKSGDVAVAELRRLGDDPWVYLEEPSAGLRDAGGGENSVLHCYKKQVFVGRVGGLQVWSQLAGEAGRDGGEISQRTFRRNYVDKEEDARRGMVRRMESGGDRLFTAREGVEGVEVWETSTSAAAVSLSQS